MIHFSTPHTTAGALLTGINTGENPHLGEVQTLSTRTLLDMFGIQTARPEECTHLSCTFADLVTLQTAPHKGAINVPLKTPRFVDEFSQSPGFLGELPCGRTGGHGRVTKQHSPWQSHTWEGGGPAEGYKREQGKETLWFRSL